MNRACTTEYRQSGHRRTVWLPKMWALSPRKPDSPQLLTATSQTTMQPHTRNNYRSLATLFRGADQVVALLRFCGLSPQRHRLGRVRIRKPNGKWDYLPNWATTPTLPSD